MRNSIWRSSLIVAALGVACFITGCKGGGWRLPGSSWLSASKKAPPTSSIAGTRETPQPPSVSYPPYSTDSTAPASLAGTPPGSMPHGPQPTGAPYAPETSSTVPYGVQQASAATDYATGPYATGSAAPATTEQGFYARSYPPSNGSIASTADARAGAYPTAPIGAMPPQMTAPASYPNPAGYPSTGGVNELPYGATPYGTSEGPSTTPTYGIPTSSSPAMQTPSPYPTTVPSSSYPTTTPAAQYPAAGPTGSYPSMPTGYPTPGLGNPAAAAAPQETPSYQPPIPSGYSSAGAYTSLPTDNYGGAASGGWGAPTGSSTTPTVPASTGYSNEYRPGSTGRAGSALDGFPTQTANPNGSTYPSTYTR